MSLRRLAVLAVAVLLPVLAACSGGDQWGWKDAGDYDPADYDVDAQGRSLVAEGAIEDWVRDNLEPRIGEPIRVESPTYHRMVDDFGGVYRIQNTTVPYVYDRSFGELRDMVGGPRRFAKVSTCRPVRKGKLRQAGVVRECWVAEPFDMAYAEGDQGLPMTMDAFLEWHEFEDGRTEAEVSFEYMPTEE